jgi:hypothetical protein
MAATYNLPDVQDFVDKHAMTRRGHSGTEHSSGDPGTIFCVPYFPAILLQTYMNHQLTGHIIQVIPRGGLSNRNQQRGEQQSCEHHGAYYFFFSAN